MVLRHNHFRSCCRHLNQQLAVGCVNADLLWGLERLYSGFGVHRISSRESQATAGGQPVRAGAASGRGVQHLAD